MKTNIVRNMATTTIQTIEDAKEQKEYLLKLKKMSLSPSYPPDETEK